MNRNLGFKVRIMLLMIASGISNAYCVMNFKTPITHHTGNATAIALSISDSKRLIFLLAIFGLFFLGSVVGTYTTYEDNFRRGFLCLAVLAIISTLIGEYAVYLLTFIFGFQNSLFLKYEGALIRSTHITGYLTDSATIIGKYLRTKDSSRLHVSIFFLISIGFFILGGILYFYVKSFSQILVALIYLILACIWR